MVVYHLQGQTGQFSVWVDGKQNSGLLSFVPESRLLFAQISSIDGKTAAKQQANAETGIKDGFEEMED